MARVNGPLMSMGASGQIGKAIVFSIWNGSPYVRRYLTPFNPMSADQGDQRLVVGGTGRGVAAVKPLSDYHNMLVDLNRIPSGQSKQSFLVKYIIDHYMYNATAFEAEYTEYDGHTAQSDFDDSAAAIGLVTFDIAYKGTTHSFAAGLMLYELAKAAIALGFTGAPYTTALASWTSTQIDLLVAAIDAP